MFSLLIFSVIVAVTAGNSMASYAQTVNDGFTIPNDSLDGLIPDDGIVALWELSVNYTKHIRIYLV